MHSLGRLEIVGNLEYKGWGFYYRSFPEFPGCRRRASSSACVREIKHVAIWLQKKESNLYLKLKSFLNKLVTESWAKKKYGMEDQSGVERRSSIPPATQPLYREDLNGDSVNVNDWTRMTEWKWRETSSEIHTTNLRSLRMDGQTSDFDPHLGSKSAPNLKYLNWTQTDSLGIWLVWPHTQRWYFVG